MRIVSTSKATGSGHTLWPKDSNIEDMPDDLHTAIEQAVRILNWQENLFGEEMPPRWMWHLDWKLESWFAEVDRKRKEKNPTSSKASIPDDNEDDPQWMPSNEYADRFK